LKKIRRNEDAVSPVIATLLVIAIAVAAAILVYVWSMGLVGQLQSGGGEQVTEQIIMDVYSYNINGTLVLQLRNVGNSVIEVDKIYVENDDGIEAFDGNSTGVDGILNIGEVEPFTCAVTGTTTYGVQYTCKVITRTGGVFTFAVIAGSAA